MDKFNVIDLNVDLASLEKDMADWSNLPYDFRLRSDENCIRLYGMTNIELYNRLKAKIVSNMSDSDDMIIGSSISENSLLLPNDYTSDESELDFNWKKQMAAKLELSPLVVIISPFKGNTKEYGLEELNAKYLKFAGLDDKNKRFCNYYSMNLWGYDVPNMYEIMKNKILTIDDVNNNDFNFSFRESVSEQFMSPVINNINKMIVEDNKLGLLMTKLDMCSENVKLTHKSIYEYTKSDIDNALYNYDFSQCVSEVTPFFNIDEINEMGIANNLADIDPGEYYKSLKEIYYTESDTKDEEYLSLGWNPSLSPMDEKNIKFARNRQIKWLKENCAKIIDITHLYGSTETIMESTANMRNLYKEKDIYPIFIVLSYTNSVFGKIINKIKNSEYSHAGLCTDSDLKCIYTFKFGNNFNGFATESIDNYINKYKDTVIDVLCVFVDTKTKIKIDTTLKQFISLKVKTKYGFGNLINILIGRSKEFAYPENLSLVCSQFVDTVLKIANIDLVDKPTNLVIPQDFERISAHPKVFKVYEGLAKEYNEKNAENSIKLLFDTKSRGYIRYTDAIGFITESKLEPGSFQITTENEKANVVLEEIRDLLNPEVVIAERKLPLGFNDKGDLNIKLIKSLEDQYQEAHKLLTSYTEENLEGIKHELARLFYVNSVIEKKIKKMSKDDDKYKTIIDLRARVLNDFKKYFKVVSTKEPDFNFTEYFQKSEYANDKITIDNSTLKLTGNLIKKF